MSELVLGWQVNPGLDPKYWLGANPQCGNQSEFDLFSVPAENIAAHTAIIAQSGSGKSFFLGRIVEEIGLRTRARCLILDPNGDFRRFSEVESATLWEKAKYDLATRRGKLCHEKGRDSFEREWSAIALQNRRANASGKDKALKLSWPAVSGDFLAESLGPAKRTELYNCHAFVKIIHDLLALGSTRRGARQVGRDYLRKAEAYLNQALTNPSDFASGIKEELNVLDVGMDIPDRISIWFRCQVPCVHRPF
ncbi:MAG: DUF87 domain-containing protein [Burkholderiales bacterium]|nr:DUF87 domain-containing protein [Burkholderiales bacterium]